MFEVNVKQCVVTTLTRRGKGTQDSPVRCITEVWDAQTGEKIAESDILFAYDSGTDNYIKGELT